MAKMTKPDSAGRQNPGNQSDCFGSARASELVQQELLDEKEAADILDVKDGTLAVWRSTGRYNLPFLKIGRKVRYRRSDLLHWLEERTRANGATA